MASIFNTLKEYKEFKDSPPKGGLIQGIATGIKRKVLVLTPTNNQPQMRWTLLKFLLQLAWSGRAIGSVITGAFLGLLSFFADHPASLLRSLINDADIEVMIIEVVTDQAGEIKFSSRGLDMKEQEDRYKLIAAAGPDNQTSADPFVDDKVFHQEMRTTDELQISIHSITMQLWILLTKAVTAPDTARDSEGRRWLKYLQQKRVDNKYKLKNGWLDAAREEISRDMSIRRFMVDILIEVGKMSGSKSRILDMILDIGNYIAEAGMAPFHLTIKYGIETRFPVLALNEFQSDLSTMANLMRLYKEQGPRAPYLVLLEDSIQNKFAPGNYSILWSFAMGVGVTLDKQMSGLNFNRGFLSPNFFRLGQEIVNKMEGNIDSKMAADMGLTQEQIDEVKNLVRDDGQQAATYMLKSRVSGYTLGNDDFNQQPTGADSQIDTTWREDENKSERMRAARPKGRPTNQAEEDFMTKYERITKELRNRNTAAIVHKDDEPQRRDNLTAPSQGSDFDVINSV